MLRSVIKSLIAKVLFLTDLAFNRQRSKDLHSESTVEEDQAGIEKYFSWTIGEVPREIRRCVVILTGIRCLSSSEKLLYNIGIFNKEECKFADFQSSKFLGDDNDLEIDSSFKQVICSCRCLRWPALQPRRVGFTRDVPMLHKLRHEVELSLIFENSAPILVRKHLE